MFYCLCAVHFHFSTKIVNNVCVCVWGGGGGGGRGELFETLIKDLRRSAEFEFTQRALDLKMTS